jgi:hypothetical protein
MANWDYIFPYTGEIKDWLDERHYPCPVPREANRLPCTAEIKWALEQLNGVRLQYPAGLDELTVSASDSGLLLFCLHGFRWEDDSHVPDGSFQIRSMSEHQCSLLASLSSRCGQLLMWPDSGAPAVIFEPDINVQMLYRSWCLATRQDDNQWGFFFEQVYGEVRT